MLKEPFASWRPWQELQFVRAAGLVRGDLIHRFNILEIQSRDHRRNCSVHGRVLPQREMLG